MPVAPLESKRMVSGLFAKQLGLKTRAGSNPVGSAGGHMTLNVSNDLIGQLAHVGWGFMVTAFPIIAFHWPIYYTAGATLILAGAKEYWDSHGLETPQMAGNSWVDFGAYCIGVALAGLAVFIGR